MKTKIFTIAEVPQGLEHDWLQHLRDFDTAHPGCHFVVCADAPSQPVSEMIDMLKVEPALTFTEIFERQRTKHEGPPIAPEQPSDYRSFMQGAMERLIKGGKFDALLTKCGYIKKQ